MRFGDEVHRSDLSATVWLNDPAGYEGGELVVYLGAKPAVFKGEAGSVIVYPSTQLHEVVPVRRGQRLVSITFIESLIPDEFQRNEAGYICLSQYMARAITLGIFGHKLKSMIPAPSVAAPAAAGPKPAEPQR